MRFTSVITNPGGNKGASSQTNATTALAGGNSNNSYANKIDKTSDIMPWLKEDDDVKVCGFSSKKSRFKTSNVVEIFEGKTLKIKLLKGLHDYTIVKSKEDPAVIAAYVLKDRPNDVSWYNAKGILSVDEYKLKQNCLRIFKDGNVERHVMCYMDHLSTFGPRQMMHVQKLDHVKNNDWFQFCAINTTFINVGVGSLGEVDQWKPRKRKVRATVQMIRNMGLVSDIMSHEESTQFLTKLKQAQDSGEISKVSKLLDTAIKFSSNPTVASICDKIESLNEDGIVPKVLNLFDAILEKIVGVQNWTSDNPILTKIIMALGLAMCLAIVVAAVGTITSSVLLLVKTIVALKTGKLPSLSLPAQCQAWSVAQSVVAVLSMAGMASGVNMTLPNCIQLGRFTSDLVGSVESVLPVWIDHICKYMGVEIPFSFARMSETPKFLTEFLEFFKEDNLPVRVLQEDKIAHRCVQLYRESLKYRPLFFDRGGEFSSPYFQNMYKKLEEYFNSVISNGSLVHDRICPLFLWLKGDAGVGKSTLINLILDAFSALASEDDIITNYDPRFKEPYSPKNMYPRIPGSEYWSGYRGQTFAVWNEIFSSADILSRKITATELLVAVENTSCPVNMADLGSKGTTFFTSSVVVATSNEVNFEALGLTCPGALARRIHFPLKVERKANLEADCSNIDLSWEFSRFDIENYGKEQDLGYSKWLPKKDTFTFSEVVTSMFQEFKSRVVARDQRRAIVPNWKKIVAQVQMFRSSIMYSDYEDEPVTVEKIENTYIHQSYKCLMRAKQKVLDSLSLPWKTKDEEGRLTSNTDKYTIKEKLNFSVGWGNGSAILYVTLMHWIVDKFPGTFLYRIFRDVDEDELDDHGRMIISRVITAILTADDDSDIVKNNLQYSAMIKDLEKIVTSEDVEELQPVQYIELQEQNYKCHNFEVVIGGKDMHVIDYSGTQMSLFDEETYEMCVQVYIDRVCKQMADSFVAKTGWTFLSSKMIKYMGYGLITGLGVTALVGLANAIFVMVSKFSGQDNTNPAYLGEKFNSDNILQSLTKDKEMTQLPRKGVRIRYAKFQGGEEGMQRWINLMDNSRMITCRYAEGFTTESNILFGTGCQAMIPLHMWECGTIRSIEVYSHDGTSSQSYSRHDFSVKLFPGYDKALVLFKSTVGGGPFKDIRRQFPTAFVSEYSHTMRLMKGLNDDKVCHYFKSFKNLVRSYNPLDCESTVQERYGLTIRDYFLGIEGEGAPGLCAYPIVTLDPRYQSTPILGFHTAQVGSDSVVTPICSGDWEYSPEFQFSVDFPYKEHFQIDKGFSFGVKGTSSGPRPKKTVGTASNTSFVKTPLYDYLPPPNFAPAVLKDVKPTPYSVFDVKYGKYGKDEYDPIIFDILENQTSELFNGILPRAEKPSDLATMMSFEEVIHGCPEYVIKSVDTSSSAGFPHNTIPGTKGTRDFIDLEKNFIHPDVERMYNEKLSRIDQGLLEMSVVQDNLKDELVTLEKVRIHKTRVFCGSELVERLVMKGICGKLVGWLKKHRATGPIQVGANAHNFDWKLIYGVIIRHGIDRRIGGDIAGMDVSTPHFVQRVMFLFFCYALNLRPGTIMYNRYRWVSFAVCNTVHVRGNRSYLFCRGNSSGNWITTLVNSVMIWFYFSCIFLIARPADEEHHKFKDCVSLVIYGDDTGGGVSKRIEWYDNLVISYYMGHLFGVDFTDPGKGQIETRFLQTEPSFLCRTFNVVASGSRVKAPLDWDSLSRLLYYYRHNPDVHTMQEAVTLNLDCFERELVHYEKQKRDEILEMVRDALAKCNFSYTFSSGDFWERRHIAGYVSCFNFYDY